MALVLDLTGLEAMFLLYYKSLCSTAVRIVKDGDIAELIVQDVFTKLWLNKNEVKVSLSLKEYLCEAVIQLSVEYCRDAIENDKKSIVDEVDEDLLELFAPVKPHFASIALAINTLPELARLTFVLSRYEHLTYKQIAKVLLIPEECVAANIGRALLHLRKKVLI